MVNILVCLPADGFLFHGSGRLPLGVHAFPWHLLRVGC
jgi:hypothetical protein